MVSPDDALVARADPELLGLPLLFDNDAALELFESCDATRRWRPQRAECTYLRYKPRHSCLAAYILSGAEGGEHAVYVIAYGPSGDEKLAKVAARRSSFNLESRPTIVPRWRVAVWPFPADSRLKALPSLFEAAQRRRLLAEMLPTATPQRDELIAAQLQMLRYKPQRRFVGLLTLSGRPLASLKMHTPDRYQQVRRIAKTLAPWSCAAAARPLGRSDRHGLVVASWMEGDSLADLRADAEIGRMYGDVGRLMAIFHRQQTVKLPRRELAGLLAYWRRGAGDLAALSPDLGREAQGVAAALEQSLGAAPQEYVPIHGDLHPGQVVVGPNGPRLIDFDSTQLSFLEIDLGKLIAHLHASADDGACDATHTDHLAEECMKGYEYELGRSLDRHRLDQFVAAGLLELAPEPFRRRQPNWFERTQRLIAQAQTRAGRSTRCSLSCVVTQRWSNTSAVAEVASEYEFQTCLSLALDRTEIVRELLPLTQEAYDDDALKFVTARVVRRKSCRRAVIVYDFLSPRRGVVRVLGKIDAKSRHRRALERQQALWQQGFDDASEDLVSTPRGIGQVDAWQMWLQEYVPGIDGWGALAGSRRAHWAGRIAAAALKLHNAQVPSHRRHSREDELAVLAERLDQAGELVPQWGRRLQALLAKCQSRASATAPMAMTGVHRDYYPDQVLVDGERLYVLDYDLYCEGEPALDLGNFLGHLIERSLRRRGRPDAYAACQEAMMRSWRQSHGSCGESAVQLYTVLTLARHVFLSTQFADRSHATERILAHCEAIV